jgi:ABC-2 type transport system ATP-binding protein
MDVKDRPLILTNLTKDFARNKAVSDVSLKLMPGEVFALVGPNGSGKTTLIKMIVGLMNPSSGTINIFGFKQTEQSEEAAKLLGYLPDDPSAYNELTGREFLWLVARLKNLDTKTAEARIAELLELFPLGGQPDELFANYSRGTKQKFAFLACLMSWPKLVIIDEPIVGLDPDSIDIFKRVILDLAKNGTTVLFATHILEFAVKVADRVGFMVGGKLVKVSANRQGLKLKALYKEVTA